MANDKKDKKLGRSKIRGRNFNKASIVEIVDPQPPDRYNLAFYAKYGQGEEILRACDKAYLTFYHETFPDLLNKNDPWNGKTPQSRTVCKCEVIEEVPSISQIVAKLADFVIDKKKGKFGTILISAHGSRESIALPLSTGSRRVSMDEMEVGLDNVDVLGKDKPESWTDARWRELRSGFLSLQHQMQRLQKNQQIAGGSWFDKDTLIRFWVCFFGEDPRPGRTDPMKKFGELLAPDEHLMLEGSKVFTVGEIRTFTGQPPGEYIYKQCVKGKWCHPDVIAEIDSEVDKKRLNTQDIKTARATFGGQILFSPPTPGQQNCNDQWIPVFAIAHNNQNIYQGNWNAFKQRWRRVTL